MKADRFKYLCGAPYLGAALLAPGISRHRREKVRRSVRIWHIAAYTDGGQLMANFTNADISDSAPRPGHRLCDPQTLAWLKYLFADGA